MKTWTCGLCSWPGTTTPDTVVFHYHVCRVTPATEKRRVNLDTITTWPSRMDARLSVWALPDDEEETP
jgi:hypothetical protein